MREDLIEVEIIFINGKPTSEILYIKNENYEQINDKRFIATYSNESGLNEKLINTENIRSISKL